LRKNERRVKEIGEWIFSAVVGGMSLRRVSTSLYLLLKDSLSFSSISAMMKRAHREIEQMRGRPIRRAQYKGLVLDGVMVTFRRGLRRRKGVLLVAVGVYGEGEFEVVELVVGDGFSGIFSAVDFVYPFCQRQLCLVHLAKTLERYLQDRGRLNRRRLRREFW